jgi:NAD(P)H dehydrogenase (quinone)
MKHAVIFAHPNKASFTASVAGAYAEVAEALGHVVVRRDLYGMGFDPILDADELPFTKAFRPGPDVVRERGILKDANIIALVYPLWLNTPPAILKGYLERVFGYGFAYERGAEPLLNGRKLISFSSSGAPLRWIQQTGNFEAIQLLFDKYFAAVCGMEFVDHVHSGSVVPGMREDAVAARLDVVRARVKEHFGDMQ